MLEELLALGHRGAEYDAWLIKIGEGDQFGSGFVDDQSELQDPGADGPQRRRSRSGCSSPARSCSTSPRSSAPSCRPSSAARAECLSWLFWQMGSAPYLGGGFGHFYAYAPTKIEYAIDRFAMEAKRQLDVLDRRLAESEYLARRATTRSPTWRSGPGTARWPRGWSTARGEFLSRAGLQERAALDRRRSPSARRCKRGRMVNRACGDPAEPAARAPRRQRFRDQDAGQDRRGGDVSGCAFLHLAPLAGRGRIASKMQSG